MPFPIHCRSEFDARFRAEQLSQNTDHTTIFVMFDQGAGIYFLDDQERHYDGELQICVYIDGQLKPPIV